MPVSQAGQSRLDFGVMLPFSSAGVSQRKRLSAEFVIGLSPVEAPTPGCPGAAPPHDLPPLPLTGAQVRWFLALDVGLTGAGAVLLLIGRRRRGAGDGVT